MRRLLALLGGIALLRAWLARRRAVPEAPGPDPAEQLRQKLAESRELAADLQGSPESAQHSPGKDQEEFAAGETPVNAEERRREVHERGRGAIDELRGGED